MNSILLLLKKIKHSFDHTLTMGLHHTSKLFPRDKNTWVFIGWHRHPSRGELFADNTKYLFLHTANNPSDTRPIWLAKSPLVAERLRKTGYESYYEKSLHGIWYALRAGKTVIDAFIQPVNLRFSGRSTIVQLMHGRGMKKNAYSEPQPCIQDLITVASPFTESLLPKSFTQGSTVFVTGYPRNDIFFKSIPGAIIDADSDLLKQLESLKKSGNKTILYTPTFRRGETVYEFEARLELSRLNAWMKERGFHFFMSLHPKYRNQDRREDFDRIHFIDDCDIYPTLPLFDLFINDYSSLFVDELLLDKPMVFFPYDLDHYAQTEGIAFDYRTMMPGPIVFTLDELLREIEKIFTNDIWQEKRNKIKNQYHAHADGDASVRICEIIKKTTKR